ncbi:MAG: glucose-1-phosphate adenylyltransferase [Lachnospiraceae bacterium]|nr:glucose-1-phosphate adenylyltransferase [Lachnospiraceae bacterium]
MIRKEMIAMLLAGGQGSRLGVLTDNVAKPAVSFGGKYRIIDFPLSNCINSGVDTVGVLTQYRPLRLNNHIGIGIPWDLDRNVGGVTILPPYEQIENTHWYSGTANAIYQNLEFMEYYNPEYVLILSGDHIYKMDYQIMLDYHKANKADVTIAVMPVPIEEASRFGVMVTDETGRINEFQEKPPQPKSNLASMGIYIFSWKALKEAFYDLREQGNLDFGMHVLPHMLAGDKRMFAYEFNGYWKDVGTLQSYWESNMELVDVIPEFNLYEEYWKVFTKGEYIPPDYIAPEASVCQVIIGEGAEIYGKVEHSVLGPGVVIEKGAVVKDSIVMQDTVVKAGAVLDKAIVAQNVVIGENAVVGCGEFAPSTFNKKVYNADLVTIGENSVIPAGVRIGRNTAILGETTADEYPGGELPSGGAIVKSKNYLDLIHEGEESEEV